MAKVELNLNRETAEFFIDWLANDTYWGHTWCAEYERDDTIFVINGHELSTYSNQHHQLVIDHCYVSVSPVGAIIGIDGKTYSNIEYALKKIGF